MFLPVALPQELVSGDSPGNRFIPKYMYPNYKKLYRYSDL